MGRWFGKPFIFNMSFFVTKTSRPATSFWAVATGRQRGFHTRQTSCYSVWAYPKKTWVKNQCFWWRFSGLYFGQHGWEALLLLLALHKSGFDRSTATLGLPHPLYDEVWFLANMPWKRMKEKIFVNISSATVTVPIFTYLKIISIYLEPKWHSIFEGQASKTRPNFQSKQGAPFGLQVYNL